MEGSLVSEQKQQMLEQTRTVLKTHVKQIAEDIQSKTQLVDKIYADINRGVYGTDHGKEAALISVKNAREGIEHMKYLENSPYFTKCIASFEDNIPRTMYFGMYTLPHLNIYSWVAPVATIRFDKPGQIEYALPNSKQRKGKLHLKDNFLIEDKQLKYYSSEALNYENTLVFQENFTTKSLEDFGLKNIVRQMEKYQDQIIRIPYKGSLLISGPAGSGKTTLVFHRIAYLCQSPETKQYFQQQDIAVFVQDEATVGYFKNLLPKLGISNVRVFTFATWALSTLDLKDYKTVEFEDNEEFLNDEYQYQKFQIANNKFQNNGILSIRDLSKFYENNLDPKYFEIFKKQIQTKLLDRFDLTLLLKGHYYKESQKERKSENKYSLVVVDEVENYLPEQIKILKSCTREATNAIVYIGDLRQKTYLFTLSDWSQIDEDFEKSDRKIVIPKSYRNTRQILEYLSSLNFDVEIPEDIKSGPPVREITNRTQTECFDFIRNLITNNDDKFIGIVGPSKKVLDDYKEKFACIKNVKVLTIHEAQGVEFQIVITVGMDELKTSSSGSDLEKERQKINRDLMYVAYTRAMEELIVLS